MEMRSHTTRPQRQNPDISTGEFVPQRIRKDLLARFVGVVHFPGKGGASRPVMEVMLRIVPVLRRIMERLRTRWEVNM